MEGFTALKGYETLRVLMLSVVLVRRSEWCVGFERFVVRVKPDGDFLKQRAVPFQKCSHPVLSAKFHGGIGLFGC